MKLKDKLKPEVLAALDNAKYQYSSSHRAIFASLNSTENYRELTVKQLMDIVTFLPQEFKPQTDIGWLYGDNILAKKYRI
tara:strand:+ start:475 stop:714 length:240 start_codon:yes stop_codon:yes gene_type:complete